MRISKANAWVVTAGLWVGLTSIVVATLVGIGTMVLPDNPGASIAEAQRRMDLRYEEDDLIHVGACRALSGNPVITFVESNGHLYQKFQHCVLPSTPSSEK